MKTDKFVLSKDERGISSLSRIEAHNLSQEQCEKLYRIVTNNWMDDEDYKLGRPTGRFLQGYQEPRARAPDKDDGWVLIEFWSDDQKAIDTYVGHINTQLGLT